MPETHETIILHMGTKTTLAQLSRETGLGPGCLQQRYARGDRGKDLVRPSQARAIRGQQKPMNLTPKDRSHDMLIQRWNEMVCP